MESSCVRCHPLAEYTGYATRDNCSNLPHSGLWLLGVITPDWFWRAWGFNVVSIQWWGDRPTGSLMGADGGNRLEYHTDHRVEGCLEQLDFTVTVCVWERGGWGVKMKEDYISVHVADREQTWRLTFRPLAPPSTQEFMSLVLATAIVCLLTLLGSLTCYSSCKSLDPFGGMSTNSVWNCCEHSH